MWPARWCSSPKKTLTLHDFGLFWGEWRMPYEFLKNIPSLLVFLVVGLVAAKRPNVLKCVSSGKPLISRCFDTRPTSLCLLNIFERVWHGKLLQVVQRVPVINWSDLIRDPNWFFFGFLQVFFIFHRSTGGGTRFRLSRTSLPCEQRCGWSFRRRIFRRLGPMYNTEVRSNEMKWDELEHIVMKQDEGSQSCFPHPASGKKTVHVACLHFGDQKWLEILNVFDFSLILHPNLTRFH